jgi:methyl-accepting chemotaxis protein
MRSIKENKYSNYYLVLEECYYYYQEYQIMYQKVLLSGKDEKIDEMKAQIDELLNYAKDTKEQNDDLKDTMEDIKNQNDDLKDTMDDIKDAFKDTADRSVPKPNEEHDRHEFILLQHKELTNRFKFIRGIQKYNESKIASKYSEYNIIKRDFNANPIQLFKQFKATIKEEYKLEKAKITANKTLKNKNQLKKEVEKIKFTGNDLELQFGYTLDNLLDKLSEVCNERFNEYNNSCDEE